MTIYIYKRGRTKTDKYDRRDGQYLSISQGIKYIRNVTILSSQTLAETVAADLKEAVENYE